MTEKQVNKERLDSSLEKILKRAESLAVRAAVHPLWTAAAVNAVVLMAAVLCFHPFFEENDDAIIAMIAEGAYGSRSAWLVYPNRLLGLLLLLLYRLNAGVRWYTAVQYALLFVSLTALTRLFFRKEREDGSMTGKVSAGGFFFSVFFLLCVFYEAYVSFQYTKAAMIIAIAGLLLIFRGLSEKGGKRAAMAAAGILLAFAGSLLRISSFYLACAFAFGCGLYELYRLFQGGAFSRGFRCLLPWLFSFGVLFSAVFAAQLYDARSYESDGGWREFREFNESRTRLTDYRYDMLQYDKYGDQLAEAGVSENDAYSWLTWQIGDSEAFTTEKIGEILSLDISRELGMKYLRDLYGNVRGLFASRDTLAAPLVMLALYILLFTGFKNRWVCLYSGSVLVLSLLYYQYSGRWNHRVVAISMIGAMAVLIYYMNSQGEKGESRRKGKESRLAARLLLMAAPLFLSILLCVQNRAGYASYLKDQAPQVQGLYEYTASRKDRLYVVDAFADQHSYDYTVFRPLDEGCFSNRVSAGSWLSNSPVFREVLEGFGATNPYRAVLELDNAFFVDISNIENKRLMLEEHYGAGSRVIEELTDSVGDFKIYSMKRE